MSTVRNCSKRFAIAVVLVSLVCLGASGAVAENSRTLTKKQLKMLLATANTPADQQKLASYYHEKARQLTAKAQEFAAQADFLATHPLLGQPAPIESKHGISCQCTSHYRYFSKLYAQEANDSEALAAHHDQLAQEYLNRSQAQK